MQQDSVVEPPLPPDVVASDLDAEARRDLRGLQKDTADTVARHLVAAGSLIETDPERALLHARFARRRASRIAVVREAAGIAAYHAGEWNEALGELRAARRMGGGPGHLAVMADIERALGRPERALELTRGPEARELDRADAIELAIVSAGARRDLGELDAAVVGLQIPELDEQRRDPWSARLFYAYADNLLAAGRESDALQWFVHAVDADVDGATDADRRIAELTGEPLAADEVEFDLEELVVEEPILDEDGAAASDDEAGTDDSDPSADEVPSDYVPSDYVPSDYVPGDEVPGDEAPGDEVSADHVPGDGVRAEEVPADDVPGDVGAVAERAIAVLSATPEDTPTDLLPIVVAEPGVDPAPQDEDPSTDALPIVATAAGSGEASDR